MITCLLWLHLTSGSTIQREVSGQVIMNFDSESVEVKFDVESLRELNVEDADAYRDKIIEKNQCRSG